MSVFLTISLFLGYTITSKLLQAGPYIIYELSQISHTICQYFCLDVLNVFSNNFYLEAKVTLRQHFENISFPLGSMPVFIDGGNFFSFLPIYSSGKRKWKNMSHGVEHTMNYIYFWRATDLCTVLRVEQETLTTSVWFLLRQEFHVAYFSKLTAKGTKTI